jgi:hypothetical protein
MRLLAKLMRPVWSTIILASGLSSKKPWNWASLLSVAFASASQSVRYLPLAGLSGVLNRPVVEIGVFLFMKAQCSKSTSKFLGSLTCPKRVSSVVSVMSARCPLVLHKRPNCCITANGERGQSRRFRAAKKTTNLSPSDHREVSHNLLQHSARFPPGYVRR